MCDYKHLSASFIKPSFFNNSFFSLAFHELYFKISEISLIRCLLNLKKIIFIDEKDGIFFKKWAVGKVTDGQNFKMWSIWNVTDGQIFKMWGIWNVTNRQNFEKLAMLFLFIIKFF